MYKLTIQIDNYDDDFLLVCDGKPVVERGAPLEFFGSTMEGAVREFLAHVHVGHYCCLDRDHDWSKETGYSHVAWFRKMFHEDLLKMVVRKSNIALETLDHMGTQLRRIPAKGFSFFHGGNQEFTVTMTDLGPVSPKTLTKMMSAAYSEYTAMEAELHERMVKKLTSIRAEFLVMGGNMNDFTSYFEEMGLPSSITEKLNVG
jgi:hypothetical protein